ncbi:MAG: hypothetical protein PG977_000905 [Bartonella clarridgeiae]|nr:MAG: hypothetical protein PG977_000905 [Bartonella clarridgeiae]
MEGGNYVRNRAHCFVYEGVICALLDSLRRVILMSAGFALGKMDEQGRDTQ